MSTSQQTPLVKSGRKRKTNYIINEDGLYQCSCSICNNEFISRSSFYRHQKVMNQEIFENLQHASENLPDLEYSQNEISEYSEGIYLINATIL